MGPSLAGGAWGAGASAHKAFSDPIRLLPEGEHVWSKFPAVAMTCKALVHREQEAAQTHLGHREEETKGTKLKALLS